MIIVQGHEDYKIYHQTQGVNSTHILHYTHFIQYILTHLSIGESNQSSACGAPSIPWNQSTKLARMRSSDYLDENIGCPPWGRSEQTTRIYYFDQNNSYLVWLQ